MPPFRPSLGLVQLLYQKVVAVQSTPVAVQTPGLVEGEEAAAAVVPHGETECTCKALVVGAAWVKHWSMVVASACMASVLPEAKPLKMPMFILLTPDQVEVSVEPSASV